MTWFDKPKHRPRGNIPVRYCHDRQPHPDQGQKHRPHVWHEVSESFDLLGHVVRRVQTVVYFQCLGDAVMYLPPDTPEEEPAEDVALLSAEGDYVSAQRCPRYTAGPSTGVLGRCITCGTPFMDHPGPVGATDG